MEGEKKTENSLPDIKDILTNSEKDEKHDDTNQNNGRNSILKNENQNQNSGDLNSENTPENKVENGENGNDDDNDYDDGPKPELSNQETQIESTFPTTTEGMDILIAYDEKVKEKARPKSRKAPIDSKEAFLQSLEPSPRTKPKPASKLHKPQRIISTAAPLSESEVQSICDKLMAGRKVSVEDPAHLQDVLTEFAHRRLAALEQSEYLKIKKIDEITVQLKRQYVNITMDDLFHQNLNQAKERARQAQESLEQTKQLWKQKEADFKERIKQEMADLEQKHQYQQEDLENKWLDPSVQRRYNKQSKVLLQQKAIEKYMVLAGDLESAEELKKRNRETEKKEAQIKFSEMQSSYESDLAKLSAEQDHEYHELKKQQDFQYQALLKSKAEAIEVAERRLKFMQLQEQEASNNQAFVNKKKIIVDQQPIPMAPVLSKNVKIVPSGPLPLPPLQVKHVKKKTRRY